MKTWVLNIAILTTIFGSPTVRSQYDLGEYINLSPVLIEQLDAAAVYLESQRVICDYTGRPDFESFFYNYIATAMQRNPQITFDRLEMSFRKFNTKLNLVAIPIERIDFEAMRANGLDLCLEYPANTIERYGEHPRFLAHYEWGLADAAFIFMQSVGTKDREQNLVNLQDAGFLVPCNGANRVSSYTAPIKELL